MAFYLFRSEIDEVRHGRGPWWDAGIEPDGKHVFKPVYGGEAHSKGLRVKPKRINDIFREVPR